MDYIAMAYSGVLLYIVQQSLTNLRLKTRKKTCQSFFHWSFFFVKSVFFTKKTLNFCMWLKLWHVNTIIHDAIYPYLFSTTAFVLVSSEVIAKRITTPNELIKLTIYIYPIFYIYLFFSPHTQFSSVNFCCPLMKLAFFFCEEGFKINRICGVNTETFPEATEVLNVFLHVIRNKM